MFYNTAKIKGDLLTQMVLRTDKQKDKVLYLLRKHGAMTAYDLEKITDCLITSIRRCLTELEYTGQIIFVEKVKGKYGINVNKYKYNKDYVRDKRTNSSNREYRR